MPKSVRRVVTGHDASGKSVVISDSVVANISQPPSRPDAALTNIWRTDTPSPRYDAPLAGMDETFVMFPGPGGGNVFRITEFEPERTEVLGKIDARAHYSEFGVPEAAVKSARHAFMHRTDTIDYAIVLEGEITLVLDDAEVPLNAGDVVIQRGTSHAWSNRGKTNCRIAFILMTAE